LRDGRNIYGITRSFDQYGSIILENAYERIYIDEHYGDVDIPGWFIVRGENVVIVGQVVSSFFGKQRKR